MRTANSCSRTALIVALALLHAGCGGSELSASALSKQADSVRSLAAEGALLAVQALEKAGYEASRKAFNHSYWYWSDPRECRILVPISGPRKWPH